MMVEIISMEHRGLKLIAFAVFIRLFTGIANRSAQTF